MSVVGELPELSLRNVVERFIAAAVQPVVLDPGEEPLPLMPDQWSLSGWNGRLVLEAWDAHRNLARRILDIKEQRRDRLVLVTERFPKTRGELQIADLASPGARELERKTSRAAFRERFHLMLARAYPEWRIDEVSAEPNLEESLSPSYTRAFLRFHSRGLAAIAAPPDATDCAGIVPSALIWLDHLRRREKNLAIPELLLYVPLRREKEAALRAACIEHSAVICKLLAYDDRDRAGAIDFADAGNIDSTLPPCHCPDQPNADTAELPVMPDVVRIGRPDGSVSLRIHGLEFARIAGGKITCGISRRVRASTGTVVATACEIARLRNAAAEDRQHPLYSMNPEAWLESAVRAAPQIIDASLRSEPIYGQVPVFAGPDRGVIDLLGIDHTGRLVVIELKATADLQLPFQALDYWLRVRKHLAAGDFECLGYFPGQLIRREPPRILLVAPALEFHSTTETLLAAFSPDIEITRVGLAADWRSGLRVMFRLCGSDRP